jgi:hypothetical protein
MVGADADELERSASLLRDAATQLDQSAGSMTATLRAVAWVGGVATRFTGQWNGTYRPRMASTSQFLRDAATQLDRNAAEQRQASRSGTGGQGGPPPPSGPLPPADPAPAGSTPPAGPVPPSGDPEPDTELLDRIGDVLDELGLDRDMLEALAKLIQELGPTGDQLLDLLGNQDFIDLLKASSNVLDVAGFVLDVVTDVVEHPGLALDERLVHALADASIRFGISEGIDKGVEFLTASLTTALLPGLGAVFAPFVAEVSGAIAKEIAGRAIDAIDGATDFVDWSSDRAVDIYRSIKDGFGLLVDLGEGVVDIVGNAWDLAGDAAGWVDDGIDWVGDAAGGAGGWLLDQLGG